MVTLVVHIGGVVFWLNIVVQVKNSVEHVEQRTWYGKESKA